MIKTWYCTLELVNQLLIKVLFERYCIGRCVHKAKMRVCQCGEFHCETVEKELCGAEIHQKMVLMNNCSAECPNQCETNRTETSLSMSEFPTYSYMDFMLNKPFFRRVYENRTVDRSKLKKSLAKINVFYDELKLTTVSQKAKISFESLISDIGGTLGVFLGASFLSFMEIFEVIMLVLQHFCKNIIGKSFKKWY